MDKQSIVCVLCPLKASYLVCEIGTGRGAPTCQLHAIKEITTTEAALELFDLSIAEMALKTSREDWEGNVLLSECIQKTLDGEPQTNTEAKRMDVCWLKSILREIQKEPHLNELQVPKCTSLRPIRCIPLLPIDQNYSLSLFLTDVLQNWVTLENYLDVCKRFEQFGRLNEESIAREFTWEIFKVTEELKQIALMISDETLYCVNSRVLTGLELCTETVNLLRSHFLTTEEVTSCTNSLGSYHYFSEFTDPTQAYKLITVLNGYSSLIETRDLDLHYGCDYGMLGYEDASDDGEYEREDRSRKVVRYIKALLQYVHLCPSHPDFKVALGMLARYFKLPAFIEWAEELQTELPINDSLSLFLDSQSAGGSTASELMHESVERFQDNYAMNRILVAKWMSLIPNNQTEALEELFERESLAARYPHVVADKCFKMHFYMKNSQDELNYLRKAMEIMKHESKFADKCAECYCKQAQLLVTNQGSQLEIDCLIYRAINLSSDPAWLDIPWRSIMHTYFSAQRYADLEHFVIFSSKVFPECGADMCLRRLGKLYKPEMIRSQTKNQGYYSAEDLIFG